MEKHSRPSVYWFESPKGWKSDITMSFRRTTKKDGTMIVESSIGNALTPSNTCTTWEDTGYKTILHARKAAERKHGPSKFHAK